jgi:hypothetical protein
MIFWLLFDQAKSSTNYNKRKKNENGNENEYDCEVSLIGITAWQEGKVA